MSWLSLQTWILNAAAVLAKHHDAVTDQVRRLDCSRQTTYQHARKVQDRLSCFSAKLAELQAENQRRRHELAELRGSHGAGHGLASGRGPVWVHTEAVAAKVAHDKWRGESKLARSTSSTSRWSGYRAIAALERVEQQEAAWKRARAALEISRPKASSTPGLVPKPRSPRR